MNLKYFTRAAILGAILVSSGYSLIASIIWSITNSYLAIHNYKIKEKAQAEMYFWFAIIAIYGVINHLVNGWYGPK